MNTLKYFHIKLINIVIFGKIEGDCTKEGWKIKLIYYYS